MKPSVFPFIERSNDVKNLGRQAAQALTNVFNILNGNISFSDNIKCQVITGQVLSTSSTKISHKLGVIPAGFLVINSTTGTGVFASSSLTWTKTEIYLTAVAGTPTVSLIILAG